MELLAVTQIFANATPIGSFACRRSRIPTWLANAFVLPLVGMILLASTVAGCNRGDGSGSVSGRQTGSNRFPLTAGSYTILGILTDNQDNAKAKENAETTILRHPDVACLVGLWSQNTPMILAALRSGDKLGQVKVVAFDEHAETLQGIRDGHVHGTIVQQPYQFGYRSVEFLTKIARGEAVNAPESGLVFIPHEVIRGNNVQQFGENLAAIQAGNGPLLSPESNLDGRGLRVAYITNSVDPFWVWADYGCRRAAGQFGTQVEVQMPSSGSVEEQKRFLETNAVAKLDGVAISPIDPKNQVQMIDAAAAVMPVICHDSDAPASQRKFYLGTSNYMAGRAAGQLIKEAVPQGGKVMLFVGKMEVLNAQERSQGIIDELSNLPIPEIFQSL
jgi:ribose transport system substrate-binding protein